ncbi:MAG: FtsQ-type POTRA domain-containing protein [bacterium]
MRFRNWKQVKRGKPNLKEEIRVVKYVVPERNTFKRNPAQRKFSLRNIFRLQVLAPILLILIILGSVGYVYVNREKLVIKTINISPTKYIQTNEIKTLLDPNIGQNFFIIFPSQIEKRLSQLFDLIDTVKVEKILPDKINVSIKEKDIKYLIVSTSHNSIWDSNYNEVRNELNNTKLSLTDISYKLLSGRLNLEDIPMTPDQALAKNTILLIKDEKDRTKKLDDFEKKLITYRITELKRLHKDAYTEAKSIYLDKAKANNAYNLEQLSLLDEVDQDKTLEDIKNYETLNKSLNFKPELVLFNEFGRIIILYNDKIIKIDDTTDMNKEVKVLNTLMDSLTTSNTDYFQVTVTGEKVVVL